MLNFAHFLQHYSKICYYNDVMNNTRISKKTKTFLSVATAIIASTAVTTLLTSCSSAKQSDIIDTGGYDKEYGINDVTYARMEDDFKTLYKSQLDEKKSSGEIDDSTYNLNLSTFQNNLNSVSCFTL